MPCTPSIDKELNTTNTFLSKNILYFSSTYFKLFLGKLNDGIVPLSKELSQLIETDLSSGDPAQKQRARDNLHYKSVIYSDISAKSTLKTYSSMFNKWKRYCSTANIPVKPPEPYTEVFEAHFDRFVLQTKNYKGIELRAKHEEGRIQLQKEKETKERKEGFIMNITNLLLYNGT